MVQLAAGEDRHQISKRYIPAQTRTEVAVASVSRYGLGAAHAVRALIEAASTDVQGMGIEGVS